MVSELGDSSQKVGFREDDSVAIGIRKLRVVLFEK